MNLEQVQDAVIESLKNNGDLRLDAKARVAKYATSYVHEVLARNGSVINGEPTPPHGRTSAEELARFTINPERLSRVIDQAVDLEKKGDLIKTYPDIMHDTAGGGQTLYDRFNASTLDKRVANILQGDEYKTLSPEERALAWISARQVLTDHGPRGSGMSPEEMCLFGNPDNDITDQSIAWAVKSSTTPDALATAKQGVLATSYDDFQATGAHNHFPAAKESNLRR